MSQSPEKQIADEWIGIQATIISCKQTLFGGASNSSEGYISPEYIVTFSYVVNGKIFKGKYRANYPQECGHNFEISYDPSHPSKNTGSDLIENPWIKIAVWTLVIIAAALIGIRRGEGTNWFQW